MSKPETERPDRSNPEWTKDDIRRARRLSDLPEPLQRKLREHEHKSRTLPTNRRTSPDVVDF